MSASATRDNLSLIAVIMKAPSTKVRFSEAQKLLDYGFNTFSFKEFGKKNEVIKKVLVNKGVTPTVDAVLQDNAVLYRKRKRQKYRAKCNVGRICICTYYTRAKTSEKFPFVLDGKTISTVDIVAKNNIEKINLFTMSKKVIYSWVDLLRS